MNVGQTGNHIGEGQGEDRTWEVAQHLGVTGRLRCNQLAEGELAARNGQVCLANGDQLQEYTLAWSTLVVLLSLIHI